MAEKTTKQLLTELSPDEITSAYRDGEITAAVRNRLMRAKARNTVEGVLEEDGFAKAILTQTVKHLQEGWDRYLDAWNQQADLGSESGKPFTIGNELKIAGKALWGEIQMVTAAFTAIGEVAGTQVEKTALGIGASPGLARVLNIATDIGTAFIPIGGTVRGLAGAVQKGAKAVAAKGLAKAAAGAQKTDAIAKTVIAEGMKAEGAMKPATLLTGETVPTAIMDVRSSTVYDRFAEQFQRFSSDMAQITATQTHEQTMALASKLGYTVDDLTNLAAHQGLNERQIAAYLMAIDEPSQEAFRLAQLAKGGDEAALNAFTSHVTDLFNVMAKFRGAEVTAGRTVEILKEPPPIKRMTDLLLEWSPEHVAAGNLKGAMQTLAEDFAALGDDMATGGQQVKKLVTQVHGGVWEQAREAYINLLLPFAAVPSFLGNSIALGQGILERAASGAFSLNPTKGVVLSEAEALSKGIFFAMGDAIKAFGQTFKKMTPEQIGRLDYQPGAIPGTLGRLIRTPTTLVAGMDNLFKTLSTKGSYYAQAIREGQQAGLTGTALGKFIERRMTIPTKAMQAEASEFALTNTFQNELGGLATSLKGLLQTGPGVLYFPFMKSPINLVKYGWDRLPGFQLLSTQLYKDIAAGGVKADAAIGRLTISNLQAMFIWNLAKEGYLTGSGPVDPAVRAVWKTTHEPYAINTKEGWRPFVNQDPATTPIGIIADMAQISDQLDEMTGQQMMMAATYVVMRNMADKSWWPNLSTMVEALGNVSHGQPAGQQLKKVVLTPLVSVATGGPIGTRLKQMFDPVTRDARSWTDMISARLPYYSKTMPPLRDALGDPVTPPQPIAGPWFGVLSPLWPKQRIHTSDWVKETAEKLGVKALPLPWTMGGKVDDDWDITAPRPDDRFGTQLTVEERETWWQLYRARIRDPKYGLEASYRGNPDFEQAPKPLQTQLIEDFLSGAKSAAAMQTQLVRPDLGKKILRSQGEAALSLLPTEDRPEAASTLTESLDAFDELSIEERENIMRYGVYGED